jgi:hypothetical protein
VKRKKGLFDAIPRVFQLEIHLGHVTVLLQEWKMFFSTASQNLILS